MQTKLFFASALLSALAATAAGCGSLDGHTGTPSTLATVGGALEAQSGFSAGSNVRVAVVWDNSTGGFSVSEDLPIQPVFPSSFVIHLDSPPPAATMITDGDSQLAAGVVVAYEDLNGNGQLDLVPGDAGQFIDKIVGANPSLYLVYISGPVSPALTANGELGTPTSGYNLNQLPSTCGGSGDAGFTQPDGGPCGQDQWLPISTPYDLTLSDSPQANEIMCEGFSGGFASPPHAVTWNVATMGAPPGGYPAVGAPGLDCGDATHYTYSVCTVQQLTLCSSDNDCETSNVELGGAPPPAGWPCP